MPPKNPEQRNAEFLFLCKTLGQPFMRELQFLTSRVDLQTGIDPIVQKRTLEAIAQLGLTFSKAMLAAEQRNLAPLNDFLDVEKFMIAVVHQTITDKIYSDMDEAFDTLQAMNQTEWN